MNDIETQRALEFMRSMRGQYIISQALCLAIKYFKTLPEIQQEPSNMSDMEYLIDNLFPIYRVVESAQEKFKLTTEVCEPRAEWEEEVIRRLGRE